jgi:hypothetical protein
MQQKNLSKLKREIMDYFGEIDVELLATNPKIQNAINEIHQELINVSILGDEL